MKGLASGLLHAFSCWALRFLAYLSMEKIIFLFGFMHSQADASETGYHLMYLVKDGCALTFQITWLLRVDLALFLCEALFYWLCLTCEIFIDRPILFFLFFLFFSLFLLYVC